MEKVSDDDLVSQCNLDYRRLRGLLVAGDWQAADYETYLLMLKAVNCKEGQLITTKQVLAFPCLDLSTIDSLWVKYSNRHFGFSVQYKIYHKDDVKFFIGYFGKHWSTFGYEIGWYKAKKFLGIYFLPNWIDEKEAIFSLDAPKGYLPLTIFRFSSLALVQAEDYASLQDYDDADGMLTHVVNREFDFGQSLMDRLGKCNL